MSYGTNAPTGLIPQSSITGATWNNQTRAYEINPAYATVISKGDPVMRAADGTIILWTPNGSHPVLGIFQGCFYLTNSPTIGNAVSSDFWPGVAGVATGGNGVGNNPQALVVDDPNVVYTVQTSVSTTGTGVTAVGAQLQNFGCNLDVSNAKTGPTSFAPVQPSTSPSSIYTPPNNPGPGTSANLFQSGFYADLASLNTGAVAANSGFKLIGLDKSVNPGQGVYVIGPPTSGVFNNVLVIVNNHIYKGGVGTVGTGTTTFS